MGNFEKFIEEKINELPEETKRKIKSKGNQDDSKLSPTAEKFLKESDKVMKKLKEKYKK